MRFSALQEDGYGVGFPQDRFPEYVHQSMMASATGDIEAESDSLLEEGSMVSNLPLLFANGYPTSLEKITLIQLERFITFMVQCSLGHDTTEVISQPQWWPKEVKFSNPLIRPKKVTDNWMANLKKLVFRCYTYHRSEYLLRFCSYLARYPHEDLEYVNNWDSTTSLYHKSSGKLLVTFRNENMNYDKKSDSLRKSLLSHSGVTSNFVANKLKQQQEQQQQQHSLVMVQPPCDDIYLCDNCDAEFIGLEKMKEHEKICCEHDNGNGASRPATPDLSSIVSELRQDQFLEYFQLSSKQKDCKSVKPNSNNAVNVNVTRRTSGRVRGSLNFTRCSTIPFSSPAGIALAKKSKIMTEETQYERLERIERHLVAPPLLNDSYRPKWLDKELDRDRWIVTYKPSRDKSTDDYVHEYKLPNSSRRKPMLSIQSQLLYVACRPVYVILTRLNQNQIEELQKDSSQCRNSIKIYPICKKAGPASKTKFKQHTNLALKRKAPTDEIESTIIEDGKEASPMASTVKSVSSCSKNCAISMDGITEKTNQSSVKNTITFINLCSSDEEEDLSIPVFSDENRDPMKSSDNEIKKISLCKCVVNKLCTKPYPVDTANDWLSGNSFNGETENYPHKLHGGLNTCTPLSPILRPTP